MRDFKRLTIFREVARRGSFSAAADALSYTQPAISHHVAQLEREVGAQLLVREPRGIRLTGAGHTLMHHADRILGEVEDAEAAPRRSVGIWR